MRNSAEERLLQLVEKRRDLQTLLQPGPTRYSPSGSRALEDVIRWGATVLGKQLQQLSPTADAAGASEPVKPLLAMYDSSSMEALLLRARAVCCVADGADTDPAVVAALAASVSQAAAEAAAIAAASGVDASQHPTGCQPLGPGTELVLVRGWADVPREFADATGGLV